MGGATPAGVTSAARLAQVLLGDCRGGLGTDAVDVVEAVVESQLAWLAPPSEVELLAAVARDVEHAAAGSGEGFWGLDPDRRTATWLVGIEGRPVDQAAQVLGLAPHAVAGLVATDGADGTEIEPTEPAASRLAELAARLGAAASGGSGDPSDLDVLDRPHRWTRRAPAQVAQRPAPEPAGVAEPQPPRRPTTRRPSRSAVVAATLLAPTRGTSPEAGRAGVDPVTQPVAAVPAVVLPPAAGPQQEGGAAGGTTRGRWPVAALVASVAVLGSAGVVGAATVRAVPTPTSMVAHLPLDPVAASPGLLAPGSTVDQTAPPATTVAPPPAPTTGRDVATHQATTKARSTATVQTAGAAPTAPGRPARSTTTAPPVGTAPAAGSPATTTAPAPDPTTTTTSTTVPATTTTTTPTPSTTAAPPAGTTTTLGLPLVP